MIRVIEDYVIVPEAYDYMVGKDTGRVDKETGTPIVKPLTYHGSLKQAIQGVQDHYTRKSLSEFDGGLYEALKVAERISKEMKDAIMEDRIMDFLEGGRK